METSNSGWGSEVQLRPHFLLQLRTDSQSEAVAIQAIRNAKGNSTCVDCGAPSECEARRALLRELGSRIPDWGR